MMLDVHGSESWHHPLAAEIVPAPCHLRVPGAKGFPVSNVRLFVCCARRPSGGRSPGARRSKWTGVNLAGQT